MIFEYPEDLLQLVNAYTSNIFTDVFFDRYSAFFDWLIADKQIRLSADTDLDLGNFIEKLSKSIRILIRQAYSVPQFPVEFFLLSITVIRF